MLIGIATTVETLRPKDRDTDDALIQFLYFLRKHAVLLQTETQREELKSAVKDGRGDRASVLLREILRLVPVHQSAVSPEQAVSIQDFKGTGAPVVVLDPALADRFNIQALLPRTIENPEIVRAGFIFESPMCEKIQHQSSWLNNSTNREQVWTERLAPLVAISDSVKIYDRYLLDGGAKKMEWRGGVKWLLEKIMSSSPGKLNVEIVTLQPSEETVKKQSIDELLSKTISQDGNGISQISLTVCRGNAFLQGGPRLSEVFHDRVISFISNGHARAVSFGAGLDMFNQPMCGHGAITYYSEVDKDGIGASLSEITRIIGGSDPKYRVRGSIKKLS